jgi:hypothetical protein
VFTSNLLYLFMNCQTAIACVHFSASIVLLCYCATVLLCYCATVLLCYSGCCPRGVSAVLCSKALVVSLVSEPVAQCGSEAVKQ